MWGKQAELVSRGLEYRRTDQTLEALNHGFIFMEDAFGDSQEMAVFVTELNASDASVRFLKENGCDLYYRYK